MSAISGIGDDVGRSPIPSIFEIETRGIAILSRERLGIIVDTLQVSFTELNPKDLWKYSGSANRPVLPPLVSTRMQTADLTPSDDSWKDTFNTLLNALPTIVQEKLDYDSKQPLENRDPAYIALSDLLTATAKSLAWIAASNSPSAPGSIEQRHADLNMALPFLTAMATVKQGGEFFESARESLDQMDSNYVHRDKISDTIRQAQYELSNFQKELDSYGK